MSVVVVGSANVDVAIKADRLPSPGETVAADSYLEIPGGKGLNQAVAASRAGASVDYFYFAGQDTGAEFLESFLDNESLVAHAAPTVAPTGRAFIGVDPRGQNAIMVVGGANVEQDSWPDSTLEDAIRGASYLILQQEVLPALNLKAAAMAKRHATHVVLTPAPVENTPDALLSFADLLILNEHEASLLGSSKDLDLACSYLSAGKALILTRGEAGASLYRLGALVGHYPAPRVNAVDTTGAGDCFVGNFVARKLLGSSDSEAINWACQAAAVSVTQQGAAPTMPIQDQVQASIN